MAGSQALAETVRFLADPAVYGPEAHGGATARVEARETHMSWVFLTAHRVYKLKKPVRYPFLDFSTVALRGRFCREELRLNRRLAAESYLAVRRIARAADGGLALDGAGDTVDWLVEMVRLPEAEMLDRRIAGGRLSRADVEALGARLAAFYAGQAGRRHDGRAYGARLVAEQAVNRRVLARGPAALDGAAAPLAAVDAALERLRPQLAERAEAGLLVDGHGDLRPEHVCLADPLQIIDCLEFNPLLRCVDPFDEVGYLGLECAVLGAGWVAPLLAAPLAARLAPPSPALAALYRAFRALLRARLCMAHLLETPVRKPAKWRPLAGRYLAAAERACVSLGCAGGR
ncbi:hypothetical protein N1F89_18940 [Aquibium sp. A9E412]|uniref:hypothetical protein n=1 Tax=Aquibium sp. A9E412 TaxID=2976767 RepID=UPI0025B27F13|nr:hypothetical protein [Aquibium sp. A9E412]MDN2568306.1 hypothetical protein [Aquibium sp. A9E412]